MIKAIDIGYTFTKDENKNMFKSAFTTDKCETKINRLCLLADLALSPDNEFL